MKPVWLIEADVYGANAEPLVAEVRRQGMECLTVPHRALVKGPHPVAEGGRLKGADCALAFGTFPFVRQVQLHFPWVPGGWCDAGKLDCSVYYARFGDFLLSRRHRFLTGVEAVRQRDGLFDEFGRDGRVFVRPAGCQKLFVGRCVTRDAFADALAPVRYDAEAVVVVAEPQPVGREWRLVVAEGRVVAASLYSEEGRPSSAPGCPGTVRAFAEEMLAEVAWRPDPIFMLDVCESGGRLRLVELNGFSCSWLYQCDPSAVVRAASDLAGREWEGRPCGGG
jgi:hypothetical protein